MQGVIKEAILPCIEDTPLVEEHDRVGVQTLLDVFTDPLDGIEYQVRAQAQETFDATVIGSDSQTP